MQKYLTLLSLAACATVGEIDPFVYSTKAMQDESRVYVDQQIEHAREVYEPIGIVLNDPEYVIAELPDTYTSNLQFDPYTTNALNIYMFQVLLPDGIERTGYSYRENCRAFLGLEPQPEAIAYSYTLAHELGHIFSLSHTDRQNNIMRPTPAASPVIFTHEQADEIPKSYYARKCLQDPERQ